MDGLLIYKEICSKECRDKRCHANPGAGYWFAYFNFDFCMKDLENDTTLEGKST